MIPVALERYQILNILIFGVLFRGLPLITYAPRGGGGSSLLYISIAYYMQKKGGGSR